jgi:aminoglycoside phosphotransferase (APT) family kinase protein
VHGDLNAGNLLVADGRLSAVIDFGCMGIGDPAVDLLAAWDTRGDDAYRATFRAAIGYDDATWARGRAWAFSVAVIALPYYRTTNPVITATAQGMITATMHDWQHHR